jgi:hypothetical protein
MRTNKRLVATVISAAALAAPAGASAMLPPPPYDTAPAGDAPSASVARQAIADSGVGTVTVLLLTGGGLVTGMAASLGGTRLRRRHSLA